MTYYDYLCRLLEPMRVYRTERGTLSGGELYAAGKALDEADGAMEYAEQEGVLQTAEGEGLARREKLFSRCPVSVSTGHPALPPGGGVLLPVSDVARVRGTEIYMAERGGRASHMGEL